MVAWASPAMSVVTSVNGRVLGSIRVVLLGTEPGGGLKAMLGKSCSNAGLSPGLATNAWSVGDVVAVVSGEGGRAGGRAAWLQVRPGVGGGGGGLGARLDRERDVGDGYFDGRREGVGHRHVAGDRAALVDDLQRIAGLRA